MNLNYCDCGIPLNLNGSVCSKCNRPTDPARLSENRPENSPNFCTNCGTRLHENMKFCGECGSKKIQGNQNFEIPQDSIELKISNPTPAKSRSNWNILMTLGILLGLALVVVFTNFGHDNSGNSGSSGPILSEELIPEIEESLNVRLQIDRLGSIGDPNIKEWYGGSINGNPVSLLFFESSDALAASNYLDGLIEKSSGAYTCDTLAFFGNRYSDVERIYKVLLSLHPDCKVDSTEPSTNNPYGENYSEDSVAGSGEIVVEKNNYPQCVKLGDTLDGGLRLNPGGGSHWGVATGKPGYCILPNSGGEKFYYSGE